MNLAERLRTIGKPAGLNRSDSSGKTAPDLPGPKGPGLQEIDRVLDGEWRDACFVVERRVEAATTYGRTSIRALASRLRDAASEASLVCGQMAQPPFVFFDLETTGLSGGAGTYAFLVGCGWFDDEDGFVSRQYMLVRFGDEPSLLAAIARELTRAGALVSFNGKSFDAPVLETRYLFHRLEWVGARLPHIDLVHPARRFWRDDSAALEGAFPARLDRGFSNLSRGEGAALEGVSDCSLATLERRVLGAHRAADVSGYEIPGRYFQFVRSGDARPLVAVLQHNRLDLLSLAGLTARLFELVRLGPESTEGAREALALGRVYARAGLDGRALAAFEIAAGRSGPLRIESLRALATAYRRARRFDDAAGCWRRLLEVRGCPHHVAREANHALAVHHEHRVCDYQAAKSFALQTLEPDSRPAWNEAVRYRLARIERKMEGRLLWDPW